MKTAIIIPARYGSTRFPGKPLALIDGRSMLSRVYAKGMQAAIHGRNIAVMIATDDDRIAAHAREIGARCVMTDSRCATGSDRVLQAADNSGEVFDFLIGLQGDAPFTPVGILKALIDTIAENPEFDVVTPVHRLSWRDLDSLRAAKQTTPFSGTTCIRHADGRALWFSKNIIPAIREEEKLRAQSPLSPVWQHMGVYGYRADILRRFVKWPQTPYEKLEGLEQLRFLENDIAVQTVEVSGAHGPLQSGIDSPEDIARAEAHIKAFGDDL
ncbi:MAG: 3-deoxy-manno-octulosonate cytidylyltransferase [Micavibrio aeruginosavorus]|uniref:3-deoxy-manno-octulosonate cytidylyltransferase n=1 Tax=Micavibrio aeruginosavorus TaxID=349221 RepID=A0A7T5R1P8_9BACT|nr:MAG: 3-deoxy-manno-octulosonate cytidylyltransferase [Micavibrio aeruginosavorus]